MKRLFSLTIMLMVTVAGIVAQTKQDMFNPIHTALVSQSIAPDARAGGMGDVGVATDADVNSQYWNPAKYPFCISKGGVSLNYTPWLRQLVNDIDLAYLAGYYRIGQYSAISASFRYFSLGEVYVGSTESDITIKPYEMSFDVGYSMMLSETFSIAANLRYLLSDMSYSMTEEGGASSAFAADIACYHQGYLNVGSRECQMGWGVNISNVGTKIKFPGSNYSEFIPTNMRVGLSFMVPLNEFNRISVSADANKLLVPTYPKQQHDETREDWAYNNYDEPTSDYQERVQREYYDISSINGIFKSFTDAPGGFKEELQEIQWSVGAEYCYNDKFTIRAGYHHEAENKGNRKYFTVGAGFRMSVFSLDAGYVIATTKSNPLDQTLRFTLAFDMDGIKDLFHRR